MNTAIGSQSQYTYEGGDAQGSNTSVGFKSLYANSTAENNVAVGTSCCEDLTGTGNTAVGREAMLDATSADYNTVIGGNACGGAVLTGDNNTVVGHAAGAALTDGGYNVCIGKGAGDNITTGNGNTCVGANVEPSAADGDNQFVFGDNIAGAGDDTFRVGKSSAYISATLSGTQTLTVTSDERKKRNINDNNLGLEFINDIKTKTFQWRPANEFPEEWEAFKEDSDGNRVYDKMDTDTTQYGLIAQEVKESMGKFDADTFPGWNEDPKGIQEVSRESFVIPLIKAVQELSQQVEDLKKKVG